MTNSALGRWSSFVVFLVGVAYFIALLVGFATRGLSAPIIDPLLGVMEALTLLVAPVLVVMMAAIHGRASSSLKTVGSAAFAFMTLATGLTTAVHFVALTATRQTGTALLVWPSSAYAIELLAWDGFLGLALVFAAFTFQPVGRERHVRRGLFVCGLFCVLGIIGPAAGNMRLQLVGVFAYGALLPGVCLLLSNLFRGDAEIAPLRGASH